MKVKKLSIQVFLRKYGISPNFFLPGGESVLAEGVIDTLYRGQARLAVVVVAPEGGLRGG